MTKNKISKFLLYAAIALVFSLSGITHGKISIFEPLQPSVAASTSTIPSTANAPWPVFQRIDALSFSSRFGLNTVWGGYNERSENPFSVGYTGQSQELTNAANGNYAIYNNLDLGSGVEALMLRVSLDSGTNSVEVRLDSLNGPVVGTCTINNTGLQTYRTVPCPLNSNLAKNTPNNDTRNLVIKFTGSNSNMRFNWFAFWAKDTVQKIDDIQKIQPDQVNKGAPIIPISGRPVRTQNLLPDSSETLARSYRLWSPAKTGECPKWMHDTYWTKAEDGKVYPTWHPPVDFNPETNMYCTYGHEHGDDPRSSEVFNIVGMPAFGYVSEQQEVNSPSHARHEDHFGHKVLVANNWYMYNAKNTSLKTTCDVTIKLHMGSHSPDALTNTAHEMFVGGKCDGEEPFNLKHFALFGKAGQFKEPETSLCSLFVVAGISPNPIDQPLDGVHRAIPTKECFVRGTQKEQLAGVFDRSREFWLTGFAGGSFYFNLKNPSRFFDSSSATKISRTVDTCYNSSHPMSKSLLCQEVLAAGSKVTWDDPRSPFRGTVNSNSHFSALAFADSPNSVIYTDAYGKNAKTAPDSSQGITFKQIVPVKAFHYKVDGHASLIPVGDYSAYGKNGVRAPN
ncbi:hypothetical protein NIES2109_01490 [Nostoc sp. HK-01]|nr:hypothetical protein NIES2109_01490 [Nostoc sp. HK-01]